MSLIKVPCMQITNMHCSGQTVSLAAGDYHATIVTVGAGLAELTFQGCHLVIPHKPEEMPLAHLGKVLIPWPNRIANGCYRYQGQEYQLPINEHGSKAAIHGLLAWRDWQISELTATSVTLTAFLPPSYGYPFMLASQVVYSLNARTGLSVEIASQNIGTVACLDGISTDIDESVIWEGTWNAENWNGNQELARGNSFDWNTIDPTSGICYLIIELEPDASSSYWILSLRHGDAWENIPGIEDVEIAAGQTEVEIMLNQTALEDIQMNGGLVITGCYYTLKKVTLRQESVYTSEHEVWSGSHDLGTDWSSFLTLSWDKNVFQDITEGSILHVEYTESPDAGWYWQLQCNDGNWNILSSCGGETVELASGDGTYSCELNDEDVASIRESGMAFNGYGIIIERIYWTK